MLYIHVSAEKQSYQKVLTVRLFITLVTITLRRDPSLAQWIESLLNMMKILCGKAENAVKRIQPCDHVPFP